MIKKIHSNFCPKIVPLVYDDTLSYYEYLNKVNCKVNEVIEQTNEAVEYMKDNITDTTREIINNKIASGEISVGLVYTASTEALNLVVTGG